MHIKEGNIKIRVVVCPQCHKRRRCRVRRYGDYNYWSCSQKHDWMTEAPTLIRLNDILKDIYIDGVREVLNNQSLLRGFLAH